MTESFPEVRLGDYVEIFAGFAFKSNNFSDDPNDIPLVKGENVGQGRILWDKSRYWPRNDFEKHEKFSLKPDDVVIAMDRPWVPAGLKWAWIRRKDPVSLLVQRVSRLRAGSQLDQTFLRYIIGSSKFESYIKPITTGVNVPHISGNQISNFLFLLPPLPTQRKIAAILSAYDDLLENNTRRIRILEEMAQAIYREWFVHFRFPGHEGVRMVESEMGLIPEGWEVVSLINEIEAIKGLSYKGSGLSDEGMPLHNLNSVLEGGGYKYQGIKFYIGDFKDKHRLNPGDIIVTNTEQGFEYRLIGFPAIVPKSFGHEGIFSHHIFRVRPLFTSWLSTSFIYYLLMTDLVRNQIIAYANGTTVNMLSKEGLEKPKFAKPPKKLIELFEEIADPTFRLIEAYIDKNTTLRKTRDLLLPKLISGEIDVSDLGIHIPEELIS